MKKLLYVAPHLSTGGLPQYLCKKIELLKNDFDIYLVEWADVTGGVLVVTRNKIVQLVDPKKFFTLKDNKHELIDIIDRVKPEIIHLEEIPEFFMDSDVAKRIYTQNRDYSIVETSHDSSYDVTQKQFFPDKFMFVSEWQTQQYKEIDIPQIVVYYPIEYMDRPNRTEALVNLGLDPNKKHILHVGLYTSRKNQAEFFEYAKALPQYEFHSLGNRADNFKGYWEPLSNNQPSNLTWWNERTDVDKFYGAMDLFLFTSRGTGNDEETMPLVIREAVSYQIPTLIYNLPVYLNYWDSFKGVNYLKFDNFKQNCELVISKLEDTVSTNLDEEAFVVSTYPNQHFIEETTIECIKSLKQSGRKIILTTHYPASKELQDMVDYYIYDKNNILTKHTFYSYTWFDYGSWRVDLMLTGENNDIYHGPSVYTNYYNAASLAHNLGVKKIYYLNYDYILKDSSYIDYVSSILDHKKSYVGVKSEKEGDTAITYFLATDPEFYLNNFPLIHNASQYDQLMDQWDSESNGLENLTYHNLQRSKEKVYWESEEKFLPLIEEHFTHKDFSRVEYFSVVEVKDHPEQFAIFLSIANSTDNRNIKIQVLEDDKVFSNDTLEILNKVSWFIQVFYNVEKTYTIKYESYDRSNNNLIEEKQIIVDKKYIEEQLPLNGYLTLQ